MKEEPTLKYIGGAYQHIMEKITHEDKIKILDNTIKIISNISGEHEMYLWMEAMIGMASEAKDIELIKKVE